jgi:general secretion pathway protein C
LPKTEDPRLLTRLPGGASLLLAIAIGAVLAKTTWQLWPGGSPSIEPADGRIATDPVAPGPARTRGGLATPLFGTESVAPAAVPEPVVTEAPPTRLDLELRGVAVAVEAADSWAIVEGPDRRSLPYRIGDALPGDAELLKIEANRIVLRHRGAAEALYFSEEAAQAAAAPRSAPKRPGGGARAIQLSPQSGTRIREYLGLLPGDPSRMTELVRALPVMENGTLKGFRLFPGQQRELFGEAGLRRGDIVTSINGMPLNDPSRGLELLNQLAAASSFQLEILRRGQPQVLNIQL